MLDSAFIQEYFRIRSGDSVGLNTDSGWAAIENANATISTGVEFRIRFKVRETAGGDDASNSYKLQVNRNSGGWVDIDVLNGSASPACQAVLSGQYADGDATSTELLTNTGTYVNGDGNEDNASASYSLTSEETELEFCLMLMSFFDGAVQNVAGDTLDFRVVETDGTVFTGTYTNPTITVAETAGYIGGAFIENPGRLGPFIDTNGNIYTVVEASATDSLPLMIKSTNGGDTWREQDGAGRPANDLEGFDMSQDGDVIHMVQQQSGTNDIRYHRFRTSDHATPDDWEIINEVIKSAVVNDDQSSACQWRSDSTIVGFWQETVSGFERIFYKIRSSGGTWGTEVNLDTTASVNFTWVTVVKGESDLIHIFYKDKTNGDVFHKSLNSSDTLSSRETCHADAGTGTSDEKNAVPPVYWDDAGEENIMVGIKDETSQKLDTVVIKNDGAPATAVEASDNNVENSAGGTSLQPVANLAVDGLDVYLLYGHDTTGDIYRDKNSNDGGWSTDVVEQTVGVQTDWVRGAVFTHSSGNGGDKVMGYIWDDDSSGGTGRIRYDEFVIEVGGAGQPYRLREQGLPTRARDRVRSWN